MPCVGGNVSAQIRSIYVTVDATDASIREVLESIESQSDLRFVYPDEVKPILTKVVTVSEKNVSANRILDQILPDAGLQYSVSGTQVRIYQAASGSRDVAQTVSGTVISGTDNSPLAGVMIYVEGTTAGTITNGDGSYTFTIPAKSKYVTFSYVGFDTKKLHVEDTELFKLVSLAEQSNTLDEVVVIGYGTQKKGVDGRLDHLRKTLRPEYHLQFADHGVRRQHRRHDLAPDLGRTRLRQRHLLHPRHFDLPGRATHR